MATFIVTTATDAIADDGRLSLREAIAETDATAAADTIRFAPAIEGTTLRLAGTPLVLDGDLTIEGDADGSGDRVTLDAHRVGQVLTIAPGGADIALRSLGITEGDAVVDGGGIRLGAGSRLTLTHVEVRGNSTFDTGFERPGGGGVFAAENSRLVITDSTIADNTAEGDGGGIHAAPGSTVRIVRSTLEGNAVGGFHYGDGGGLFGNGSTVDIEASTIAGNRAWGGVAGIAAPDSRLTIATSTIAGNRNRGGNEGYGPGGGIEASGRFTLTESTVTGNTGPDYGNSYSYGAGILLHDGTRAAIRNSIVAGNYLLEADYEFRITDDSARTRPDDIHGRITASNGHNLFGSEADGSAAGDLEGVAPARLFAAIDPANSGGRLALQGGPTATVALRDAADNPAVGRASQADAGAVDQRGEPRPQPDGSAPDVGAFELDRGARSPHPSDGADVLFGTVGGDRIDARAGDDLVDGLAGGDRLQGGPGDDTVLGGADDDALRGGAGSDRLVGGTGADRLLGEAGDDRLAGGFGSDRLAGGPGFDTATWERDPDRTAGMTLDLAAGTAVSGGERDTLAGIEAVEGSPHEDIIRGTAGDDRSLAGAAGDDRLLGRAGDDRLLGGAGQDTLAGGRGDDRLDGGTDGVTADGRDSTDTATWAFDTWRTAGLTIDLAAGTAVDGGERDTLADIEAVEGSPRDDIIRGSDDEEGLLAGAAGNDRLFGGDGWQTLAGGRGADRLDGGAGDDTATWAFDPWRTAGVTIDLAAGTSVSGGERDTLVGIEGIEGSLRDDTIRGTAGDEAPWGRTLAGAAGDDRIFGLAGDDFIYGNEGNDRLVGGSDGDSIHGDEGNDRLVGGAGDDFLWGDDEDDAGDDRLDGGAGSDQLVGGDGDDILSGGAGGDRLHDGGGDDILSGGTGGDSLRCEGGSDTLNGGHGNDTLTSDVDSDELWGGSGRDSFVFMLENGFVDDDARAVIGDFTSGDDRIDLELTDADTFIGTAAFSGTAGEVRTEDEGPDTIVQVDTDGDGEENFGIRLIGAIELSAVDFLF